MPIASLRLRNFKCFADSGDVPLAPLTIVFGRNNVGKSSLLQSLFLFRQTLDAPESDQRLALSGPLWPAGSYADLVHEHRVGNRISVEMGVAFGKRSGRVTFEFSCDSRTQAPRLNQLVFSRNGSESLKFCRAAGSGGPFVLHIRDHKAGYSAQANFEFPAAGVFPIIGLEPKRVGAPSPSRQRARKHAQALLSELKENLVAMRAVGSFRAQPERRYEFVSPSAQAIDISGRDAMHALISSATARRKPGSLVREVNRWLKLIGRVRIDHLRPISRVARLYETRLRDLDSGKWVHYSDVGFGIGQALPVLVEGLRTPKGGLFVVQEPEIHLHPDAQLAMADFLIGLVQAGRRVIVETHSENLLLRVRHRIVAVNRNGATGPRLHPSQVKIVQVVRNPGAPSEVRTMEIDALGQVSDWPPGFMEESNRERLDMLEAVSKRMEKPH